MTASGRVEIHVHGATPKAHLSGADTIWIEEGEVTLFLASPEAALELAAQLQEAGEKAKAIAAIQAGGKRG